jgi:hypothetical protein
VGVSAARNGLFEVMLRLGEGIQSIRALLDRVTIAAGQRILIFRGPSAETARARLCAPWRHPAKD